MYLPENTISVHVFQKYGFPIMLYARNEWEQTQIEYLENNYNNSQYNTLIIARWSKNHKIPFKIFYPHILSIITNRIALRNYIFMKIKGF